MPEAVEQACHNSSPDFVQPEIKDRLEGEQVKRISPNELQGIEGLERRQVVRVGRHTGE